MIVYKALEYLYTRVQFELSTWFDTVHFVSELTVLFDCDTSNLLTCSITQKFYLSLICLLVDPDPRALTAMW